MSDEKKGANAGTEKRARPWESFGVYKDDETGVQLIMQKAGSTFSPSVAFTHNKTGELTKFGRIVPDFSSDLNEFEAIDFLIEALQRMRNQINHEVRESAKKDKEEHGKRQARRSNPGGLRHTMKNKLNGHNGAQTT